MLPLKRQKAGLRMSLGKFLKVMGRGEVDGHEGGKKATR